MGSQEACRARDAQQSAECADLKQAPQILRRGQPLARHGEQRPPRRACAPGLQAFSYAPLAPTPRKHSLQTRAPTYFLARTMRYTKAKKRTPAQLSSLHYSESNLERRGTKSAEAIGDWRSARRNSLRDVD